MYFKQKLNNGLKLILAPLKETKAATVLVLLPVGSRYETEKINGVSHFIEHLMFKGTKKRPTALDIAKALDSVGAEYNAFTAKDQTGYYIKAAAENIELAFDILSDMIFNSRFAPAEMEKERGVIIEEINMYEDNPMIFVQTLFEQTIFSQSSLGRQISGPKAVVKNITRKQLLIYKEKYYRPHNIVLTVAGNFKESQVKTLVNKYFKETPQKKEKLAFKPFKPSQSRPRVKLKTKETEQAQICLGFLTYALNDPRLYPLYLLAVILGGNMSSRLFAVVREQHGLAYYIKSEIGSYQDTGELIIQAGLDKSRIRQAISLILKELKKVRAAGVTAKELESAKEFLKGKLVLDLEDSESVANWYGRQALFDRQTLTPEQKIKKIFAVKIGDIQKIAKDLIKESRLNLALIGPFKEKKAFEKLLRF